MTVRVIAQTVDKGRVIVIDLGELAAIIPTQGNPRIPPGGVADRGRELVPAPNVLLICQFLI